MKEIEFKQNQYLKECGKDDYISNGVLHTRLKMKNPPPPPDKKKSIWDAWQVSNDEAMIMADYFYDKIIRGEFPIYKTDRDVWREMREMTEDKKTKI
jgi:hypothetical protein